jgi:putative ABC transport system permease protein
MFFTYLRRELRRRSRQAIVVSLGLAIGIGLVMTVSSASAGVKDAQTQVLHSLYGVGTDMTVTKTASLGSFTPQHFGFGGLKGTGTSAAGTKINRNTLRVTGGDTTLPASDVTKIASLSGTKAATGGLVLSDTSFSGTLPKFSFSGGTRTITRGGGSGRHHGGGGSSSTFTPGSFTTGSSSFNITSFTVTGIQISSSGVGPLDASQVTKGHYFSTKDNDADLAVVSASYAKTAKLSVGSKITVAGKSLKVIGISVSNSNSADVYIPLGTAQKLSGLTNDVSTIYVSATSSSNVSALSTAVKKALPGSTEQTSASLANDVTGSLSSASSLANNLGKWLSIAALIVAFLTAGLLMMAAVSRRTREFGTLKAIGWKSRRIVGQVMGEGIALGIAGGVGGLIIGIIGSQVISSASPALTANLAAANGGGFAGAAGAPPGGFGAGGFGGARVLHHHAATSSGSVLVHLSAPLQGGTIALAVGLAIAGGLVAGGFGAWRASRLRPAAALRSVA